jgi:hypothetical protein
MLAALLSTFLLLLSAPATVEATPDFFGFNDNSTLAGDLEAGRDANLLAGAGANSARITVDWSYVERRRGRLRFGLYDGIYWAWVARGVRPLLVITGAPEWARTSSQWCRPDITCHVPPAPAYNRRWSRFARAVARRYRLAAAIEVWNEPNYAPFFLPKPDPVRYTQLLRWADRGVKRGMPTMPVLGGSLAAADTSDSQSDDHWAARPFLRAMYANGARTWMDGLAVHVYPREGGQGRIWAALDAVLETQTANLDVNPIWLTETGVTTTGSSDGLGVTQIMRENQQAIFLGDVLQRLMRRPFLKGLYVHTLLDPKVDDPETNPEGGYGVVRRDMTRKPAYCAIARVRGASTNCSAPGAGTAQADRWAAMERVQAAAESAILWHRATSSYRGFVPPNSAAVESSDNPDGSDSIELCDRQLTDPRYCVMLRHGQQWNFVAKNPDGSTNPW